MFSMKPQFNESMKNQLSKQLKLNTYCIEDFFDEVFGQHLIHKVSKSYFRLKAQNFFHSKNIELQATMFENLFELSDLQKDDFLDINEFGISLQALGGYQQQNNMALVICENLKQALMWTLTPEEMQNQLENLGISDGQGFASQFFQEVDLDRKGFVTYWDIYFCKEKNTCQDLYNFLRGE